MAAPGILELVAFPDGSVGLYLAPTFFLSTDGGQTWEEHPERRGPGSGGSNLVISSPRGGYIFAYLERDR